MAPAKSHIGFVLSFREKAFGCGPRKERVRVMPHKNEPRKYDETFKRAAVEFLHKSGCRGEDAAAELGIPSAALRHWAKKAIGPNQHKTLTGIAQLRAENEALRSEVLHLQVQWDI